MHRAFDSKNWWPILLSLFSFLLISGGKRTVVAQEKAWLESADSLLSSPWNPEGTFYQINLTKLQRLLSKSETDSGGATIRTEVIDLAQEAERYAGQGEIELASLLLDEALRLLANPKSAEANTPRLDPSLELDESRLGFEEGASESLWIREMIVGADLWREEFEMGAAVEDSTISEGTGNPYYGVRLGFNPINWAGAKIRGMTEGKISRDYFSAQADLDYSRPFFYTSVFEVANNFAGTSYRNGSDLRYLQDEFRANLQARPTANLTLEFDDEVEWRHYLEESDLYASFTQNQATVTGYWNPLLSTRVGAAARLQTRNHSRQPEKDFDERRWKLSVYQSFGFGSSGSLEGEIRQRNYPTPFSDSLLTNDYQENYFQLEAKIRLLPWLTGQWETNLEARKYRFQNAVTPDYREVTVEPRLIFDLQGPWEVGIGYRYSQRLHPNPASSVDQSIPMEDFYAYGATVSIDFISWGGFLLSLNDTYEYRRYPNSTKSWSGFSLYSDRAVNSLLAFISWSLSKKLKLGVTANWDDDRDKNKGDTDSRSTLFSIELNYKF